MRGRAIEGIRSEKLKDIRAVLEQAFLGIDNEWIAPPGGERGEPEVPIEARLKRRIDSRRLGHILRLISEGICDPVFAVPRALKFDFVSFMRHDGEQAVAIGDSEWLEQRHGPVW